MKDRQLLQFFLFKGCAQQLLLFQDDSCFKTPAKLESQMAVNVISWNLSLPGSCASKIT